MDDAPYQMLGDVAVFRLGAGPGLEECVQRVKEVIAHAKRSGVDRLLVDVTGVGFGSPTVGERHWVMTEWASAGRGAVRFALVIRPEFADPQHFGTMVARNHGLAFRAFTEEARAVEWLRDHPGQAT